MNYVKVKIPKATLYLTPEEYQRAVRRGKVVKRSQRQRQREAAAQEAAERKRGERLGAPFWMGSQW